MLLLLSGVYLSCQGYAPLLPGQEGKEGWRKAGHTYLLRIGVPVIPEARVSQHKPMFLPLQADQAGGGEGREKTGGKWRGSYRGKRRNREGCSVLRPLVLLFPLLHIPSDSPLRPWAERGVLGEPSC